MQFISIMFLEFYYFFNKDKYSLSFPTTAEHTNKNKIIV